MTPRAYWDQDYALWEQHPNDAGRLRCIWSPFCPDGWGLSGVYAKRLAMETLGVVLVPTC
jgi:hypothetical protein